MTFEIAERFGVSVREVEAWPAGEWAMHAAYVLEHPAARSVTP